MKIITIDIFALKSNRKNSKCEVKTFRCFPEEEGMKQSFTYDDKIEIQEWAIAMKEKGYEYFQVVVMDGTNIISDRTPIFKCMHDILPEGMNMDIAVTLATNFMNLYNYAIPAGYQAL